MPALKFLLAASVGAVLLSMPSAFAETPFKQGDMAFARGGCALLTAQGAANQAQGGFCGLTNSSNRPISVVGVMSCNLAGMPEIPVQVIIEGQTVAVPNNCEPVLIATILLPPRKMVRFGMEPGQEFNQQGAGGKRHFGLLLANGQLVRAGEAGLTVR